MTTTPKNARQEEQTELALNLGTPFLSGLETETVKAQGKAKQDLLRELADFKEFGKNTVLLWKNHLQPDGSATPVPVFVNEFWTAKQCAAHSLHEISYRACFKPQLPRFFIERLTHRRDAVYDPFMGRGTTLIEAALLGRSVVGNDINPLSEALCQPRLCPVHPRKVDERLEEIDFNTPADQPEELLHFYHPDTLREISSLKAYLAQKEKEGKMDAVDRWIRMVALNRLTGHSKGFFSVYTLPPNQAVSVKSQIRINDRRKQTPPRRYVKEIIAKKSNNLLQDVSTMDQQNLDHATQHALFSISGAASTPIIPSGTVSLVVTSPPFLDIVQYATDNWLRCWFIGVDAKTIKITVPKKEEEWKSEMAKVFQELARVLKPGGYVAFEVGEVRKGKLHLEDIVLPAGSSAGLRPILILINDQKFTKTANCWGVDNNSKGTNTNRIVLFQK